MNIGSVLFLLTVTPFMDPELQNRADKIRNQLLHLRDSL
jgi:hypothetical protein|tara:strand:- start:217 stop:333 length:117 start_codon:yes stop_codon:yes gene_type:complete